MSPRSWLRDLPTIYYDRTGIVEHLYDYQVADVLSLFFKLTNPGGQLFLTTHNYQSAWQLIELLLDRFGLVATLEEVQHVTQFTKRKLSAMCERVGWRVGHIGTFNGIVPFLAPISCLRALGTEKIEFLFNRVLHRISSFAYAQSDQPSQSWLKFRVGVNALAFTPSANGRLS